MPAAAHPDSDSTIGLQQQFGVPGAVRFEMHNGGPVAHLTAAGGTAVVALQGAHVLSYVPAGGSEVMWLSPIATLGTAKAVRGGIPICWPWFGPHPDAAKPAHGFVRTALWQVVETSSQSDEALIALAYDSAAADASLWPHRAQARLEVSLGSALRVSLTTQNIGETPFALTQALHSYLAIGDISQVSVTGLDGCAYIDKLEPDSRPVQTGEVSISAETDRIYFGTRDPVVLYDRLLNRTLHITRGGSSSLVVWNPWIAKGERLGDLGPEGYRRMLCLETCNAGPDVVMLAPGASHHLQQILNLGPLEKQT